jgi:hypothetical protein
MNASGFEPQKQGSIWISPKKKTYLYVTFILKKKTRKYFAKYIQEHMDESHKLKTIKMCSIDENNAYVYTYAHM